MMSHPHRTPAARNSVFANLALVACAGAAICVLSASARAQEDPGPILQWFECPWQDMERRMPDFFVAGWGAAWVPPVARGYVTPTNPNQNSSSAGYDVFDRFDLGKPGARTAYGTEAFFDSVVEEFHRAGALIYIDIVLNHNTSRRTDCTFQQEGGYPGFFMGPDSCPSSKTPTADWGDFHPGFGAGGYYQSTNPSDPNYCLLKGDLVSLIDINHATNNNFIRQPATPGDPLNIPGGTFFNNPNPDNARFYPDQALGTDTIENPGMWFAGALTTGSFAPPCDVPARNEPAGQLTLGRFNLADPSAGDPIPENALGYLMRNVQWMLDVHHADGFRIDAAKHMNSWAFDTFFDSVVSNRRVTPDGRFVTPYSFVESVESNDFTFDRYVRKPNGRTTGRLAAGDAFGNRDALDLTGAGRLRDLINNFGAGPGTGNGTWTGGFSVLAAHIDSTDDGFNNGTVGVNHIWSHDNGSTGSGGSAPATPTATQQGWFAHAYLLLRTGQAKVYHNARGVNRTSGFWPRAGVTPPLGVEPTTNVANRNLTTLVQLANQLGRGEFHPRAEDGDAFIFERRSNLGGGVYVSNCIVGASDRYAPTYDQRVIATGFPQGTRLIELSGNAADPAVDVNGDISDILTVGAGGSLTVRIPTNVNASNVTHNRGWVVYAPAIPLGTLSILGSTSQLPAEGPSVLSWRRRTNPIPIVTADSFTIQLTTTNGDPGAANNDNADDNAVFRLNAGFQDFNASGGVDIDYTNEAVPGYEEFVTTHQPLAGTANTQGLYQQAIDATQLVEGYNYLSAVAFRKRNAGDPPLFREFRTAIYVDRLNPGAQLTTLGPLPDGTTQFKFLAEAMDRTVTKIHFILNPSDLGNPPALATTSNLGIQDDRLDWSRTLTGLHAGLNQVLIVAFEESGKNVWQVYEVFVGTPCDDIDFNNDDIFPDIQDLMDFLTVFAGGPCSTDPVPGCNDIDFNNDEIFPDNADLEKFLDVFSGGNC